MLKTVLGTSVVIVTDPTAYFNAQISPTWDRTLVSSLRSQQCKRG